MQKKLSNLNHKNRNDTEQKESKSE